MLSFLSSFANVRSALLRANPVRFVCGLLLVALVLASNAASAQTAGSSPSLSFDHAATGFVLGGQHALARCESCHIQGVFRGTPRDCASCHRNAARSSATQFPLTHIPTTQPCDLCHRAAEWTVVIFRHQGVTRGTCMTCHNGIFASGKPVQHISTTKSCDTCHNTLTWIGTTYNHDGVVAGTCASCHNGSTATGKPSYHIPTTDSCDTCHSTITWTTRYNHTGVAAGSCATCHNRITAPGMGRTHIPTASACDTCHKNYVSFTPATMDHGGLNGQCSTCHSGTYLSQNAQSKPASHVSTNAQCDSSGCHASTTTWATTTFNHALAAPPVTVGDHTCSNCHKAGGPGLSKPTNHIPTVNACDFCHANFTAFRPAAMSHDGTAGQCSTCHNGGFTSVGSQGAQAKSATHVATTAQCDYCHKSTAAWVPTTYIHEANARLRCSVCHNGVTATGKGTTHIPDNRQCDTCHTNQTSFLSSAMNHTGLTGQCSNCHNGAYDSQNALGKPAGHTVTTAQCDTCHTTTAWKPASFAHSASAVGQCSTCHNGTTATGKGGTHIPDNRQCDTCHRNYTSFLTAAMDHTGLNGQCSTCHGGAYVSQNAQAKSASHVVTTAQCDTCHASTTTWATTAVDHSLFTPAVTIGDHTCANCHKNGGTGLPKPTSHVPTTGFCDTCHTNFVGFAPARMDHTGTTGQCSTCHNGGYTAVNAQAKSATHVTTTASCDACHHSTSVWLPAGYTHESTATGQCSTCHNGVTATGKNGGHIPDNRQCDTCHKNYAAFAPATMDHTGLANQCSICHSGAYTNQNARAKHLGHVTTTAQCDTCHKLTTAWLPAGFSHDAGAAGQCSTCHNGTTATGKGGSHVPDNRQCDSCHTNYVAFAPATMNHTGLAGQCSTCHSGAYLSQNAQTKPATHVATTAQCDSSGCHTSTTSWATATFNHALASPPVTVGDHTCANCHKAGGSGLSKPTNHIPTTGFCDTCHKNFTAFTPATMDHTGTTGQCATCHNGAYTSANAQAKPVTHITTAASCDACHTTSAWKPATFSHAGVAAGTCASCHGVNATGKPAGHIPTVQSCDQCHRTSAWMPLLTPYSHSGVTAGSCANCHVASYSGIDVKPVGTHIPTSAACDQCHRTTAWLPLKTYAHTGVVTGSCTTCHTRPFTNITVISGNHIPTTLIDPKWSSCDACHKNYSSFSGVRFHSVAMTTANAAQYKGTCPVCHEYGNPYGLEGRKPGDHKTAARMAPNSCDNSGCHSIRGF